MGSSSDFAEFIEGQFQGLEGISVKRMFGGYCLHFLGRVLGFIFDNQFLMEDGPTAKRLMPDAERVPLFPGSKDFVIFPNVDNSRYMQEIAMAVYEDLPLPKPRKSKKAKAKAAAEKGAAAGKKEGGKAGASGKKGDNTAAENGSKAKAAESKSTKSRNVAAEENSSTPAENKRRDDLPPEINDFLDFRAKQK